MELLFSRFIQPVLPGHCCGQHLCVHIYPKLYSLWFWHVPSARCLSGALSCLHLYLCLWTLKQQHVLCASTIPRCSEEGCWFLQMLCTSSRLLVFYILHCIWTTFFFFFLNCYFNVKFWRKWLAKSTVTFKLKISLDIRMHELTYSVDWGSFKWLTVCHMYRHVAGADTTTCFQVFHSLWNPLTEEERGYHLSMSQLSGILYLPSTQQYLEWISLCPLSLCY